LHLVGDLFELKLFTFLKYLTMDISGNLTRIMNYWNQTYFQVSSPECRIKLWYIW